MFQSSKAKVPGVFSTLKATLPAMVFAVGLASAGEGQAAEYFLQSSSIDWSYSAVLSGAGYATENVVLAPIHFTAFLGDTATGPSFDLMAFCVDIFHNITVGPLNYVYDDSQPFNSNSAAPTALAIDGATQFKVATLANYGALVYASNDAAKTQKLAGVQGAIWQVINSGLTVDSNSNVVDGYIADYTAGLGMNDHGPVGSGYTFIAEQGKYGTEAARQSFIFASPSPEPSTWALLIGGFGLVGMRMRQRRPATAAL